MYKTIYEVFYMKPDKKPLTLHKAKDIDEARKAFFKQLSDEEATQVVLQLSREAVDLTGPKAVDPETMAKHEFYLIGVKYQLYAKYGRRGIYETTLSNGGAFVKRRELTAFEIFDLEEVEAYGD